MGRIDTGIRLVRNSLEVVRRQPGLIAVPIIAGVIELAIAGLAAGVGYLTRQTGQGGTYHAGLLSFGIAVVALIAMSYVGVVARAVVISRALKALSGSPISNSEAFSQTMTHSHKLFFWTLINATVSALIRGARGRTGMIGALLGSFVSVAWSVVTFFVVPVILVENLSTVESVKRSASLFRQRWGEELVGSGAISIVLMMGLFAIAVVAALFGSIFAPVGIAVAVLLGLPLILVAGLASGVFNAALYAYATSGTVAFGFTPDDLNSAFQPKRRPRGLGF